MNAVKCDNCGIYGDLDGPRWNTMDAVPAPPGWLDVRLAWGRDGLYHDRVPDGGLFCRPACAAAWLSRVPERREPIPEATPPLEGKA